MSDTLPDDPSFDWTPERLARFEAWQARQAGPKDVIYPNWPPNPTPLAEGVTPPPIDGFGRGPGSPFYRRKGESDGTDGPEAR